MRVLSDEVYISVKYRKYIYIYDEKDNLTLYTIFKMIQKGDLLPVQMIIPTN